MDAIQRNYATIRTIRIYFNLEPDKLRKKTGELKTRWKSKLDKICEAFTTAPLTLKTAYKISRETLGKVRKLPNEIINLIQAFTWDYYFTEEFQNEQKAIRWPTQVFNPRLLFF